MSTAAAAVVVYPVDVGVVAVPARENTTGWRNPLLLLLLLLFLLLKPRAPIVPDADFVVYAVVVRVVAVIGSFESVSAAASASAVVYVVVVSVVDVPACCRPFSTKYKTQIHTSTRYNFRDLVLHTTAHANARFWNCLKDVVSGCPFDCAVAVFAAKNDVRVSQHH